MDIDNLRHRALELAMMYLGDPQTYSMKEMFGVADDIGHYISGQHQTISESNEIDAFFEKFIIKNPVYGDKPFILYPHQRLALSVIQKRMPRPVIIDSDRKMGVTTLLIAYAVYRAKTYPNSNILFCCDSRNAARNIMEVLLHGISKFLLYDVIRQTSTDIGFTNGSTVFIRPVSENSACGLSIDTCIIDNAEMISHKILQAFLTALFPTIATGGQLIMGNTKEKTKEKPTEIDTPFDEISKNAYLLKWPWYLNPTKYEC